MKNIFTRALALTIVFALCAVSAFAAPAFTNVAYDLEAGTIDVATNGYTAGKSATLLVVKAGANLASLAANDIIYIDQEDNLAAADQAWTDIPLADRIAALNAASEEDITSVNVYIGGTDVTAAVPYADEDGNPLSVAVAEEEEPADPVITTAYTATLPAAEYATVEAAIAALVVTKVVTTDGVAAAPVTLAASEYTVTANPTAPAADATVTLTVAITADTAAVVAPVTFTYKPVITTAYAVTVAAGEYTSLDAVKAAALTVTKTVTTNGVAAAPVTLAAADYTAEYADNAGTVTITIKVGGEVVATTTATYTAAVEPPVTGKTGIKGKVMRYKNNGVDIAKYALVMVADGQNVIASTYADANGDFELAVPAGTYRVFVSYIRLTSTNYFDNYKTVKLDTTVADGALTELKSTGYDYIYCDQALNGDYDGDGDIDALDYVSFTNAFTGAK